MFGINRFDPREEERQRQDRKEPSRGKRTTKRKSSKSDDNQEASSTLKVVAPKAAPATSNGSNRAGRKRARRDEALDDLDVLEDHAIGVGGKSSLVGAVDSDTETLPMTKAARQLNHALHLATLPLFEVATKYWKLAPFLCENLKEAGHDHFFPIQALVIPEILSSSTSTTTRIPAVQGRLARDVCVASPTGSGKTLAFVLPVLQALWSQGSSSRDNQFRRLRALIILPSRDLATQVYQVARRFANGSNLKLGLAIGQSDFAAEQHAFMIGVDEERLGKDIHDEMKRQLLQSDLFYSLMTEQELRLRLKLDPTNLRAARALAMIKEQHEERTRESKTKNLQVDLPNVLHDHEHLPPPSAIDVLVATPGRLLEHMEKTPGFSLRDLQYLILDEADRLVSQSYHSFWQKIVQSTTTSQDASTRSPLLVRHHQLRKFLFSATLTKDPQKLAALGLVHPVHLDARKKPSSATGGVFKYSLPTGLSEFVVECTAEQKPLVLLALLLEYFQDKKRHRIVLVFTSSKDSTHRLARLLQLLWIAMSDDSESATEVAEFSSSLNQTERSRLMERCRIQQRANASDDIAKGEKEKRRPIKVLVCSDGMSRGMDLPSIEQVIHYDVPSFAKTYVHRCGRTARAGSTGTAISLLKGAGQAGQFHSMRRQLIETRPTEGQRRREEVPSRNAPKELVRHLFGKYKRCLKDLQEVLRLENTSGLGLTQTIPESVFASANSDST